MSGPRITDRAAWLESRVDKSTGCWIWLGAKNRKGYGLVGAEGKSWLAHRYVYTLLVGPIPEGLDADHVCRVRACVRPEHIEPVTHRVNVMRALRKDECKRGHRFTPENCLPMSNGGRRCRACTKLYEARAAAKRHAIAAHRPQRPPKSHCKRGHEFTSENTRIESHGGRRCLTCVRTVHDQRRRAVRIAERAA